MKEKKGNKMLKLKLMMKRNRTQRKVGNRISWRAEKLDERE